MYGSLYNKSQWLFQLSTFMMYGAVFLGIGFLYIFLKKFRRILVETTNPIDKVPDLSQYYDTSKKVDIDRKDDFMTVYNMPSDEIRKRRLFKWIDKRF